MNWWYIRQQLGDKRSFMWYNKIYKSVKLGIYSNFNKITKQWWGATHFRVGSRNQPRPNKGFKLTQFDSIGKTVEYFRWWKRLRRGNIANAINSIKNDEKNIVTSGDIEKFERGELKMPKKDLSIIYKYLGINNRPKENRRYI